jgi:cyclase
MKRLAVLIGLVLIGAISMRAAQQAPAALEIQKVKEKLYMISGGGGNTAVFLTKKGVVLVDTKNPGHGPAILEKVKSVTAQPVIMVINTHTHFDHTGSNSAFTGAVEFVAQENCKTGMEKLPAFQSEEGKKFLPSRTYKDKLTLLEGEDKIELYHFGPGHTNGDTFVVFRELKTMHSGDIFSGKNPPFIDVANGGDPLVYPNTLAKAATGIHGVDTVIPGHNPVLTWSDFQTYGDFMRDVVAGVSQAKKDGKTADQAADGLKLENRYTGYNFGRLKDVVAKVYVAVK